MRVLVFIGGLVLVAVLAFSVVMDRTSTSVSYLRSTSGGSAEGNTAPLAAVVSIPWLLGGLLVAGSLTAIRWPTVAMAAFLAAGVLSLSDTANASGFTALVLAGISFVNSRRKA